MLFMCEYPCVDSHLSLYNILCMIYFSTLSQTIIIVYISTPVVFCKWIPCVAPFAYYQDVIEAHFIFRASGAIW